MQVRSLKVRNFRGIKELEWKLPAGVICLVGPGDATKTTILDALSFVLSPKWSIPFCDADFFQGNVDDPILIEVVVIEPPVDLVKEEKYGLMKTSVGADGSCAPDMLPDASEALVVRLTVDETLEPEWVICSADTEETKVIRSRDRARFNLFRLDERSDFHLSWGHGSALSRLTGREDEIKSLLAKGFRAARAEVDKGVSGVLQKAATQAYEGAKQIGLSTKSNNFTPGLDPAVTTQRRSMVLFDGEVPARQLGLGSRRLAAVAVQRETADVESVFVIDEVEYGLEPYRLRFLIGLLKGEYSWSSTGNPPRKHPQALLTTHSATTVVELNASELFVVRNTDGTAVARRVSDVSNGGRSFDPQALARSGAEGLLAKRIVVCEGSTEVGLFRGLSRRWRQAQGLEWVLEGTCPIDGGGDPRLIGMALVFSGLGYPTAVFMDSDKEASQGLSELEANGIEIIRWEGSVSTEQRVASDLPFGALARLITLVLEVNDGHSEGDKDSLRQSLLAEIPVNEPVSSLDPQDWVKAGACKSSVREAVGLRMKRKKWFKTITKGQCLGEFLASELDEMSDTDTHRKLEMLRRFSSGLPSGE